MLTTGIIEFVKNVISAVGQCHAGLYGITKTVLSLSAACFL